MTTTSVFPSFSSQFLPLHHLSPQNHFKFFKPTQNFSRRYPKPLSLTSAYPPKPGTVSVVDPLDLPHEKDYSFLERVENSKNQTLIISKAEVKNDSTVLVSLGSEQFVKELVECEWESMVVVHESVFVLAGIKMEYDNVECWLGDVREVPMKWGPFDVVFLGFLPGLVGGVEKVVEGIKGRCVDGARLVISHPEGTEVLEKQRKKYPGVVVSDLPDRSTLEKVASTHSFRISEFVDEPGFYVAVLKFVKS